MSPFFYLIFLINLPFSIFCQNDFRYSNCSQDFSCGDLKDIDYPFWGGSRPNYCGHPSFQLECRNDEPFIRTRSQTYRVLSINQTNQALQIRRTGSWNGNCPSELNSASSTINTTFNTTLFSFPDPSTRNLTLLYDCPTISTRVPTRFTCSINGQMINATVLERLDDLSMYPELWTCRIIIVVPAELRFNPTDSTVEDVVEAGFELRYLVDGLVCDECEDSGGHCGYNITTGSFTCFCRDGPRQLRCSNGSKKRRNVIIIGTTLAGAGVLLACVFFLIRLRRKKHQSKSSALISRSLTPDSSIKPDLERGTSSYFQTPIFSYAELQEATDNFDSSKEIGDGGFGTVYHGTLRDGRVVAVKRLYENNYKRHDQFMNELEILSRLRHRNLVTLYGCTTRHSRELLLVYEYIPNGTVADNLHGDRASTSPLTWPVRLSVAIETADALSYLHASDIIHRDVKTTNILLDHNFHVKVADFGLSRLFPINATHVSTAPQGTPGYVDPEYYQCYQLNDKSDVYSFGVVLIELISSKPAVDIGRHRHEINLSNMAINKIHNDALHELVDPSLGFESDYSVRRMITMVAELAFRCLQQEKDMRPCMVEVLKCLKDIESAEKVEKAEEVDIPADARLLKNVPPFSPTSVTDKWVQNPREANGDKLLA